MSDRSTNPERHVAYLAASWLSQQFERDVSLNGESESAPDGLLTHMQASDQPIVLLTQRLYPSTPQVDTQLSAMEARLSDTLSGDFLLWVPPGGTIPNDEPSASAFVLQVDEAAKNLAVGDRTDVKLPGASVLAKLRDDGAYVSVMGGLSPYWTNISEHVRGAFLLDSTQLKRLPQSEEWRESLFRRIGENANALDVEESVVIESEQAWTLRRTNSGLGTTIIAAPPDFDAMDGSAVRRTLRRLVQAANTIFEERVSALQGLLLIGSYEYLEREPITSAIRGFDPRVYGNIDFIALAADGDCRFILPPRTLPWNR